MNEKIFEIESAAKSAREYSVANAIFAALLATNIKKKFLKFFVETDYFPFEEEFEEEYDPYTDYYALAVIEVKGHWLRIPMPLLTAEAKNMFKAAGPEWLGRVEHRRPSAPVADGWPEAAMAAVYEEWGKEFADEAVKRFIGNDDEAV